MSGSICTSGIPIPAPDAPWMESMILEVSDDGVCLDVGALPVPNIFGLAFTAAAKFFGFAR